MVQLLAILHGMDFPNVYKAWHPGYEAFEAASNAVYQSGLDPQLLNLVMTRVSQINGCAFCLDMHTADAVKAGVDQRKLNTLAAWRDVDWFTTEERAALALAESVTRIGDGRSPDDHVTAAAVDVFGDETFAKLMFAIVVINGWNRLNATTHVGPRPRP